MAKRKVSKATLAPRSQKTDVPSSPSAGTPDVMTIEELAVYLKLAVATLYKKAQAHEIPFTKVGNLLRFTKVSIDRWLARNTVSPDDDLYQQFARLQSRYHFQTWLEGRGVNWRELSDEQLADLAKKALEDLRTSQPEPRG
jgi:excisionase family DNA binding protein